MTTNEEVVRHSRSEAPVPSDHIALRPNEIGFENPKVDAAGDFCDGLSSN